MVRKALLISLLILMSTALYASSWLIGVEGGYAYSMIKTTSIWDNVYNDNGHGFDVAVPVEYQVNDWFSITTGARFIMKSSGYRNEFFYSSGGFLATIDDYTKMHFFVEFPLGVRFSIGLGTDWVRALIGGGGYVGVRAFDVYAGNAAYPLNSSYDGFSQVISFTGEDNLFDGGLYGEAGLSFEFDATGYLYLMFRYQYGLTSLTKDYRGAVHTYFDNLSAGIGYMFRI